MGRTLKCMEPGLRRAAARPSATTMGNGADRCKPWVIWASCNVKNMT
jgi:hypothetical protein